jgi:hypothetical protein
MTVNNVSYITNPITQPIKKGSVLKSPEKNEHVLPIITPKNNTSSSPMVLPKKQDHNLYESLAYDDPSPQQRSAVNEYIKVSHQQQREEITNTMSFHFIV